MSRPTRILITGATGAQGGSVARHLLKTGHYQVRCITRRSQSEAARALADLGAEVVEADLDDPPSLRVALRNCDGVFGVTNYWEHGEREVVQGCNLVDAILHGEVRHSVLSTLPHTSLLSGGRLHVRHFDTKARVEEYARGRGIPATFVHVAAYYENFLRNYPPRRQRDGTYAFHLPQGSTPLAGVAVEDIGGVVAAIFDESFWYRDKVIGIVGDDLTCEEYAGIMSRVLGRHIEYRYISAQDYAALGFPGASDIADMFEFYRLFVPNRKADLIKSRELYPEIRPFERWVRENADKFAQAMS